MKKIMTVLMLIGLTACSNTLSIPDTSETPKLMQRGSSYQDLISLPKPRGKIFVSVYDFRDQTGQYKPQPDSNFSTAVPQGAISLLMMSLLDSKWFVPLEREGLQNLLTERKIIRAAEGRNGSDPVASLKSAKIMIEGGIVAYDTNIKTGGAGARYLGIGANTEYRTDQVTVSLRLVDVTTGAILNSVTTSKTIFSLAVQSGAFRFIDYKDLLEVELGYTNNEPVNIAIMSAIDSAVVYLIVNGIDQGLWAPSDQSELVNKVYQRYSKDKAEIL